MRVAVVHDWLTVYAGAERVLEQILVLYPDADLFSVVDFFPKALRPHLHDKRAHTTFIQRLPFARKWYRAYLPLMPIAIEQLDLSRYDLVISSSHAVAKGVITAPDQLHICYCHSPLRYAWDMQGEYLGKKRAPLTRYLLHKLRLWDARSADGVDVMIANSQFIARRIEKCYRRESEVIYPPISLKNFPLQEKKKEFYVTASRLVSYKRVDVLVDAFRQMPEKQLVVIGEGPLRKQMERRAPSNVTFLGHVPGGTLAKTLGEARAFLYAAVEDFGIAPLEAQSCGTPVIAYRKGGVMETVKETGLFYGEQTATSVVHALQEFESQAPISAKACRENAERFTIKRFQDAFLNLVERLQT